MLVSIVIPTYNAEKHLAACIESCLSQTYKDIEIIAINDGSTDHSLDILSQYSNRVKIFSKVNGGIASTLNEGISHMSGDWFKWLSADDMLTPNAVEDLVLHTKKISDPDTVVFMDEAILYEDGTVFKPKLYYDNAASPFEHAIRHMCHVAPEFIHLSLIHKSIFENIGKFDEDLPISEDYEMGLRACMHGYKFHHVPKITYTYRKHPSQTSKTTPLDGNSIYRTIIHRALNGLDKDTKKKYLKAINAYWRKINFKSGIWHYANMDRPALKSDRMGGGWLVTHMYNIRDCV